MGDVLFYHLTESSAEATLLSLLPRALQRGWQVELRVPDAAHADRMDIALWGGPQDSFLPHGIAGGDHDADQPVLLTTPAGSAPGRACLMTAAGALFDLDEVGQRERICLLFDGHDPQATEAARGQWRLVTKSGATAQYWAQERGQWQKKADSS